jgi:hypothetical protein
VVVVQEQREQPDVFPRRLEQRVLLRANRERLVEVGRPRAVDPHELDRLHRLRDVVFGDLEIRHLEIGDRLVAVGRRGDVNAYEVRTGPEDGLWRRLRSSAATLSEQESACGLLRVEGRDDQGHDQQH